MTIDRNYRGVRTEFTYGREHPVIQALTSITAPIAGDKQVTNSGWTLVAGQYEGQVAIVIPRHEPWSGGDGKRLYITGNTTTTITFEEVIYSILTDADSLLISQRNVTPTDLSNYFGHVEETECPERKLDVFKGFYKDTTSSPRAHEIVPMKASYEASIPLRVVNGKILALAMGHSEDDASAKTDTTKTLTYDIFPGQKTITSTAHGISDTNQYLQIGTTSTDPAAPEYPEIRQVDTVTTDTITFTEPFNLPHCALEKIYTVTAGYITHTLKIGQDVPYWSLKKTYYDYSKGCMQNGYCKIYRGLKAKSLELSIATADSPLQASIGVVGLSIDDRETAREATVDKDGYTGLATYIHKGAVSKIDDITVLQAGDFSCNLDREMDTKYYSETKPVSPSSYEQTYNYLDPSDNLEGLVNVSSSLQGTLHSKTFWEIMRGMSVMTGGSGHECSHTFTRATNDTLTVKFYNMVMVDHGEGAPKGGEVPEPMSFESTHFEIIIKDNVYYYM